MGSSPVRVTKKKRIILLDSPLFCGYSYANLKPIGFDRKPPAKPGKVTITHPVKDIPARTLKSTETQVGLKFQ